MIEVKALKPKTAYREIIEINVPVRFYWNPDGSFDGIELGEFKTQLTPWEDDMLKQCLNAIAPAIGINKEELED